ncbi:hypothetical protein B4U79_11987 [Dinothrombium tinctorium]|uniref:Nose resistant to fluoxetine protein 6-like protein n=1 Tax=Dinothrombium tinctorium TaxID=1965070 RepID=A0A443RBF3_9ACAR|nr:hypothetical protein B4U79_11987 [Dinothrombium tinctorium]
MGRNNFYSCQYTSDEIESAFLQLPVICRPLNVMNEYYGKIYIKPYCRVGPYLVGIALGYIIHSSNGKFKISKTRNFSCWFCAISIGVAVLLAMSPANNGTLPSDAVAAVYSASSRIIWAACLGWVTFACVSGNGGFINSILSSKIFIPLSRLSYSAYLIHPIVIAAFYGSRESAFDFSHYLMVWIYQQKFMSF